MPPFILYVAIASAAPSVPFTWSPRLRVGESRDYACVADNGTSALTKIEVVRAAGRGFDLRFTHDDESSAVVTVDATGTPIRVEDPDAVAEEWRLSQLAKFRLAVEHESDESTSAQRRSAELIMQGVIQGPTTEDISAFELSRASAFLPVSAEAVGAQPLDVAGIVAHPLYRGGGRAHGTTVVTRARRREVDLQVTLYSDDGAFIDLTMRTLALSNEPDADLRSAWIFLSGLVVEEKRIIRVQRRTGWPTNIERSVAISSPFGTTKVLWRCNLSTVRH